MLAVQTSPLLLNNTKNIRFYSVYVLLSCNEGSAVQYKAIYKHHTSHIALENQFHSRYEKVLKMSITFELRSLSFL